jgi:hypothetical protein
LNEEKKNGQKVILVQWMHVQTTLNNIQLIIVFLLLLTFDDVGKCALYDKLGMAIAMGLTHTAEIRNL